MHGVLASDDAADGGAPAHPPRGPRLARAPAAVEAPAARHRVRHGRPARPRTGARARRPGARPTTAPPVASPSNGCSLGDRGMGWRVRVLGVDPGLTRCGLGVVDGGPNGGREVRCVAVDVVRTPADAPLAKRLLAVGDEVERWIAAHRPDVVAVERVFSQHNVRTVDGHRPGQRGGGAARRPRRAARRLPHAERGEGGRHRRRTGGQAAGHRHGDAPARARRGAPAGRRRRRARPGDLPLLARSHAGPHGTGAGTVGRDRPPAPRPARRGGRGAADRPIVRAGWGTASTCPRPRPRTCTFAGHSYRLARSGRVVRAHGRTDSRLSGTGRGEGAS